MNIKTKALGIIAGAALSLSLIVGVGAEATNTSTTLVPAKGSCVAAATQGSIDLGTWNFDPETNAYVHVVSSTPGSITTEVTQTIQPNYDCNVRITVSTLTGPDGTEISGVQESIASGTAAKGANGTYTVPTNAKTGAELEVIATLASVPDEVAPGLYTGTITIDASSAAF